MSGARSALIVATNEYDDARLAALRSPAVDAEELAAVLADPEVGAFEVTTVLNQPWHQLSRTVAQFFRDRRSDDLVLLHFSCHGVKDDSGELYFAASDTSLDLLEATAFASSAVNRAMNRSRAGRVLLFLDCCYAGAFARGMVARAGGDVDLNDRLGGRGRAVITASSAMQFAFEGDELVDEDAGVRPSLFTRALVEGLRSGEADRDLDGWVSLDDLYSYVHDTVTAANPDQTPRMWAFDIEGSLHVARRGAPVTTPAELPPELLESRQSPLTWERAAVVEPLADLLRGGHPGRALAARLVLEEMATQDDSARVRAAARAALGTEAPVSPPAVAEEHGPVAPSPEPVAPSEATLLLEPVPPAEPPLPPAPSDPSGRSGGRWASRRRLAMLGGGAVVLVAVLIGYLLLPAADGGDTGDGDGDGDSGGGLGALAAADIVATQVSGGDRQVVAIHPDGTTTALVDEPRAAYPTLAPDRLRMIVLKAAGQGRISPWLYDAFGKASRLFGADATDECPRPHRPAWDLTGRYLAVVCSATDSTGLGLWLADLESSGRLHLEPLDPATTVTDAPTWDDSGNVVYVVKQEDTTVLMSVPAPAGTSPQVVPNDDEQGWIIHPDWCEEGLLYEWSGAQGEPGSIHLLIDGHAYDLPAGGPAEWPTWGPGCRSVAWLRTSSDNTFAGTLWTASLEVGKDGPELGKRVQVPASGQLGPPAWGSR